MVRLAKDSSRLKNDEANLAGADLTAADLTAADLEEFDSTDESELPLSSLLPLSFSESFNGSTAWSSLLEFAPG